MNTLFQRFFAWSIAVVGMACSGSAWAAKLVDVRVVDNQHLAVTWLDSEVFYDETATGPTAYRGHMSRAQDRMVEYPPKLNTRAVVQPSSFSIVRRGARPMTPAAVWRRAKVIGTLHARPEPPHGLEHIVYLKLPEPMVDGATYTVRFKQTIGSDRSSAEVTFDQASSVSEAIHVNLYGQTPGSTAKHLADLYMWLGDGGARDYSAFEGNPVWLINAETGARQRVGTVGAPRPRNNRDVGRFDFTASDVWPIDFTLPPNAAGGYRLVVQGVGSSPVFEVGPDSLRDPFALSVIGFYYMRIGEAIDARVPAPRQPQLIPGQDGFRVIRTTLNPDHPDWESLRNDPWDHKDWSEYVEPGEPTNPNAYGGYADALDWDRRHRHIQIVWDLCLPYLLTNGQPADDDLGLPDSGNGIPDLLDAARYGADFWLRLRDGDGNYSMGINNPLSDKSLAYQAKATPWMAWANAANAALLADAFRVTGNNQLSDDYRDQATEAWQIAGDRDLDASHQLGTTEVSGRDLKAIAAASLFNLTGDNDYQDAFVENCVIINPRNRNRARSADWYQQNWAVAAYLMGSRTVPGAKHNPNIVSQLTRAVHAYAAERHIRGFRTWPSRRSSSGHGHFQSVVSTQTLMTAHAIAADASRRDEYLAALIGEADWGLGRNPLNMVLMTGPDVQTGIGTEMRHVQDIYTAGRNDGTPGLHPGHTPFMNSQPWGRGGFMNDPKGWYGSRGYPAWEQWPYGEALWRARYCFANNEFTPQKTMSGKSALLGYLHAVTSKPE